MDKLSPIKMCKACQQNTGEGKYCQNCGQATSIKRITLSSIGHEAFHFFTHLDKGFPYTVKKLLAGPGKMQREYLDGVRIKYQKPFSMFLISATVVAVVLYWINVALSEYYGAGDMKEALFFDRYMVLLLVGMVPLFGLLVKLFFFREKYNLAEILVFTLYTVSVFFLLVALLNFIRLIFPDFETRWLEVPVVVTYNSITFNNFFVSGKRWVVFVKGVVCSIISFGVIAGLQDYFVDNF